MRRTGIIILLALFIPVASHSTGSLTGTLRHYTFPAETAGPQWEADVWLPADYDSTLLYSVLYMNDGQMLFDSSSTWNKQEWCADETATRLMEEGVTRPFIIVGVWNRGEYRYTDYYPEKALSFKNRKALDKLVEGGLKGEPLADEYLSFLVKVLKPFIDSNYPTLADRDDTFIMGSSMGGLISLYAVCEYPEIFGGAGCISTHLPMISPGILRLFDNYAARAFRSYLAGNLPDPADHRIYFDYGSKTLDKWYRPYQRKIDRIMMAKGYSRGNNWITERYKGANHSERSWSARLRVPFKFILGHPQEKS